MIRRCTLWTAAVLAVFVVTAAQAAEDVYHAIPANSPWPSGRESLGRDQRKTPEARPVVGAPPVGLLDSLKGATGVNKGLDESGSAACVIMAGRRRGNTATSRPPSFLIPVSDYKNSSNRGMSNR